MSCVEKFEKHYGALRRGLGKMIFGLKQKIFIGFECYYFLRKSKCSSFWRKLIFMQIDKHLTLAETIYSTYDLLTHCIQTSLLSRRNPETCSYVPRDFHSRFDPPTPVVCYLADCKILRDITVPWLNDTFFWHVSLKGSKHSVDVRSKWDWRPCPTPRSFWRDPTTALIKGSVDLGA